VLCCAVLCCAVLCCSAALAHSHSPAPPPSPHTSTTRRRPADRRGLNSGCAAQPFHPLPAPGQPRHQGPVQRRPGGRLPHTYRQRRGAGRPEGAAWCAHLGRGSREGPQLARVASTSIPIGWAGTWRGGCALVLRPTRPNPNPKPITQSQTQHAKPNQITAIYYLNEHWQPDHGGELRLYPFPAAAPVNIAPLAGRLVLMSSTQMHHR